MPSCASRSRDHVWRPSALRRGYTKFNLHWRCSLRFFNFYFIKYLMFCKYYTLHSIQDLLNSKSYINTNSIKSRLKSLKQDYNIFAYIWIYYDWFKNSLFSLCLYMNMCRRIVSYFLVLAFKNLYFHYIEDTIMNVIFRIFMFNSKFAVFSTKNFWLRQILFHLVVIILIRTIIIAQDYWKR